MPSDRSRPPDNAADAYTGVVMQQGRVLLDRDFNAERDILDDRDRITTRDVIGPRGTPDNGFAVGTVSPPLPNANFNLAIGPGTMYVGGVRAELPAPVLPPPGWSYFAQPDWLFPDPPAAALQQTEIVWLQLDEQEVSAAEDPDLLEVALGGPDTTQRLRMMRTIRRAPVTATSPFCQTAWAALQLAWMKQGISFDNSNMMRLPTARMQVAFDPTASSTNLCDPTAAGGYLYSENQLIRVKWVPSSPGSPQGTLLWGYDNASFIYRASLDPTGQLLTLSRQPPDAFHFPGQGQYVEILRTVALLGDSEERFAEDGSGLIPRCIAEDTGFVTTLASAYDPTQSENMLVLAAPGVPAYIAAATNNGPLFVRIWQGGVAMGPNGGSMTLIDPVTQASNGLTVTITVPPDHRAIAAGAFWMMAVRPGTPQVVWPAALRTAPQPPDGPRSWACPLAAVEWPNEINVPRIHDCRLHFDNLVKLTARPAGCCSVSLTPDDITIDTTLQSVVDSMTIPGTICLGPGVYTLAAPLRIGSAQTGLTIVAEHGATLQPQAGVEAFGEGLIVVAGADNVTLRGLTLRPTAVFVPANLFAGLGSLTRIGDASPRQQQPSSQQIALSTFLQRVGGFTAMMAMIGLRAAGCTSLTVENCQVILDGSNLPSLPNLPLVAVGLFATGACAHLTVLGSRFDATDFGTTQSPGVTTLAGFTFGAFVVGAQPSLGPRGAIGILVTPGAANFLTAPPQPAIVLTNLVLPATFLTNLPQPDAFTSIPDATGLVVKDNTFNGLTTAVSAFGLLDQARVCDNTIVNCAAGIWLRPIAAPNFNFAFTSSNPDSLVNVAGDPMWLKLVLLQQEAFLAWLLGLLLPPPAGAVSGIFASPPAGTSRVTGNNVMTVEGFSGATDDGMPALAIVTDTFNLATDVGPGFVVAENRLQARTPTGYPCCVLALTGRLTVTGNLLSNEQVGSPPRAALALAIYPDNNPVGDVPAPRICVTGNVLEGMSNLAQLQRTDAAGLPQGMNTWVPFNASA